jgi:hypothetical protein
MICEKCAGETETMVCTHCGETVVKLGPYCYLCGKAAVNTAEVAEQGDEIDLSARVLCSDEACIGVVNDEGFCKLCGKKYIPESPG